MILEKNQRRKPIRPRDPELGIIPEDGYHLPSITPHYLSPQFEEQFMIEEELEGTVCEIDYENMSNSGKRRASSSVRPVEGWYSYAVLGLLFFVCVSYQQNQQSLGFIYGYMSNGDPFYSMKSSYPELSKYYGLFSGSAFCISQLLGIFIGLAVERRNRAKIVALACIGWSTCSVVTGSVESLPVLAGMRLILGAF